MTRIDRKALTIAIAAMLVFCASASANALTITSLSGLVSTTHQLSLPDLSLSGWSDEDGDHSHYTTYVSGYLWRVRDGEGTAPVPEPSSAPRAPNAP